MHLEIDFQVLNNCYSAVVKNKPGNQDAMIEESRKNRANNLMPHSASKEYHVGHLANVN